MKRSRLAWYVMVLIAVLLLVSGLGARPLSPRVEHNLGKLTEYGKDPGLGVRTLQQQGYTGKGVTVAIIDQPMRRDHPEYKDAPISYHEIWTDDEGMRNHDTSMHGPGVTSLLMGRTIGVAPDVTLVYVAAPTWLGDQQAHADALRKLIEINHSLPEGQKIRAVSISDAVDPQEKNPEAFQQAIAEAEAAGIWVFTVGFPDLRIAPLGIQPYKDKEKPSNYQPADWLGNFRRVLGAKYLWVPTENRTVAREEGSVGYQYDEVGGMSWGVPYLVGVVALGLQEDPGLTRADAVKYLWESATRWELGRIINPPGFVSMVKRHKR